MASPRAVWQFVRDVFADYFEDKAPRLAAALAYYALFAVAPIALLVIAVASLVVGTDAAQSAIAGQARAMLGPEGGTFVVSMVERAAAADAGLVGTVVATIALLIGAGGVIVQLQDALNTVWEVQLDPKQPLLKRLRKRLRVYVIVMAIAFLLLVSLAVSAVLKWMSGWNDGMPGSVAVWWTVDLLVTLFALSWVFAFLFKLVPDATVGWRSAWIGGAVTGVLFSVAKAGLGFYLARPSTTSTFGPASAVVILVLWVYVCAQVVLLGAEVTQGFARRIGRGIRPDADAVAVTRQQRKQEGLA